MELDICSPVEQLYAERLPNTFVVLLKLADSGNYSGRVYADLASCRDPDAVPLETFNTLPCEECSAAAGSPGYYVVCFPSSGEPLPPWAWVLIGCLVLPCILTCCCVCVVILVKNPSILTGGTSTPDQVMADKELAKIEENGWRTHWAQRGGKL